MKMAVVALAFGFVLMMSGCSSLEIATGYVVDQYCDQPEAARLAMRELISAGAHPHYVAVSCEYDNNFL